MLTSRGSLLLAIGAVAMIAGTIKSSTEVTLAGTALVFWLAIHWLGMHWIVSRRAVLTRVTRSFPEHDSGSVVVASGETIATRLEWTLPTALPLFQYTIVDDVPVALQEEPGSAEARGTFGMTRDETLSFRLTAHACGRFRFAGLSVKVVDWIGLFEWNRFVPCPSSVTVLPFQIRSESTTPVLKGANTLSTPGQHAHRRPGISAELLGIREYQPGDPPRTIAWKATARSNRFMSREFEMEVPVRATLHCSLEFADPSWGTANGVSNRVTVAAASLARLLLADRDPVALTLASPLGLSRLPHGAGRRQLTRIIHRLVEGSQAAFAPDSLSADELYDAVWTEVWMRYPQLFEDRVNFIPPTKLRLLPGQRRQASLRRRLAVVLAHLLALPAGHEVKLAADSTAMVDACRKWVRRHGLSRAGFPDAALRRHAAGGTSAFDNLALGLRQSRARARDAELMIVVSPMHFTSPPPEVFLEGLRTCRAAGHRVMWVVCPASASSAMPPTDPLARQIITSLDAGVPSREATSTLIRDVQRVGVQCAVLQDVSQIRKALAELGLIRTARASGSRSGPTARFTGSRN